LQSVMIPAKTLRKLLLVALARAPSALPNTLHLSWCFLRFLRFWQGALKTLHKLAHEKLDLNTAKHFFNRRVVKHWNRLPREIVESPSAETFKV